LAEQSSGGNFSGEHLSGENFDVNARWKSMLFWLSYMERYDLLRLLVLGLLFSIFSLVTPLAMQTLVNTFLFTGLIQPIIVLVAAIFVGLVVASFFRVLQVHVVELLQRRLMVRSTFEISKKVTRSDPRFLQAKNGMELVNRAFDIEAVQKSSTGLLIDGTALILQTVLGLSILALYHEVFILFDVVFVFAVYALIKLVGFGGTPASIYNSKKKHELIAWLESLVSKRLLLNHPGAEALAEAKTHEYIASYIESREKFYRIFFKQILTTHVLQILASVGLLGLGGYLVVENQLTVGQLVAAELIVSGILFSLTKFQKHLEDFYNLVSGLDKVGELLEIPQGSRRQGFNHQFAEGPAIEFQNVVFAERHTGVHCQPISKKVPRRGHLVVRGPHGSGKSRLLEAVNGVYYLEEGTIKIDGIDIRTLSTDALHSQMLYVNTQQFLPGTLLDNLTFGLEGHDPRDIASALDRVGLSGSIATQGEGYLLEVNSSGYPFSPSQRVQLALARCLLLKPKIILVDQGFDIIDKPVRDKLLPYFLAEDAPWTLVATSYQAEIVTKFKNVLELEAQPPTGSDDHQSGVNPNKVAM
jgi:putative ABC transport system ATP-binding protein